MTKLAYDHFEGHTQTEKIRDRDNRALNGSCFHDVKVILVRLNQKNRAKQTVCWYRLSTKQGENKRE